MKKLLVIFIQFLIILSLVSFSIETIPGLSKTMLYILRIIEVFTIVIFSFEYLYRLCTANQKLKYAFSFYGVIDLLAILPFYVAPCLDLRAIRIVRLFRLFRVIKIFQYNRVIHRAKRAFLIIRGELALLAIATVFLLYISSIGIYYFERTAQPEQFKSIFHCLWWAVVTLTTVGYGDTFPITVGGRIFTSLIILIGIGVVAVPTGLIASAFKEVLK